MSKKLKSRKAIGLAAKTVNELIDGRLTKGFIFVKGNWRKINGGNAIVSSGVANGNQTSTLTFNGEIYDGDTRVLGIEY